MNDIDPLDSPSHSVQAWESFRAAFASAYLLLWIVTELGRDDPEYFSQLWSRLGDRDTYKDLFEKEGEWHGEVPVHTRDGDVTFWAPYEVVSRLEEMLFPHGVPDTPPTESGAGATVVSLHGVLEWYARQLGVATKGSLPDSIREFLVQRESDLDSSTFDMLRELDALRHIIVHNRQIVDEKYREKVPDPRFREGEIRLLRSDTVHEFAAVVYKVAELLRRASS